MSYFEGKLKPINIRSLDWPRVTSWALTTAAAILILVWQLSGITYNHLSSAEQGAIAASGSWHAMLGNALFLPYKIIEWAILQLGGNYVFTLRLAPVIFALIGFALYLSIVRRWFGRTTYVLAGVLFGSCLWQLHFGRLAIPAILYTVVPLVVIRLALWLRELKKDSASRGTVVVIPVVAVVLTLYVPGAWLMWFVLAVWQRNKLLHLAQRLPTATQILGGAVFLLLMVPLAYSFWQQPTLIYQWLGYGNSHDSIVDILRRFYEWPMYLLGYGPNLPSALWLGRQALVSIFPAATALFGVYFYVRNLRLRQTKILGLALVVSVVLFVLSDGVALGFANSIVLLLAGAGIGYSIKLWRQVFPRNPLALSVAIVLLSAATALTVIYTTRSYFVAWHYHPSTKQAFRITL